MTHSRSWRTSPSRESMIFATADSGNLGSDRTRTTGYSPSARILSTVPWLLDRRSGAYAHVRRRSRPTHSRG